MTLTDDFLATLAGAAVAGVIGLVTLLTQQWLADRRQLNEQILAPAFNYVLSLPNSWPWEGLSEPDWSKIDSYHWLKVRAKFRFPLVELSARLEAHSKAYQRYSEFMLETGQASFSKSICEGLSKYVNPQDSSISAQSIGIEGRAIIELRLVVWGLIPDVLTNHDNPRPGVERAEQGEFWSAGTGLAGLSKRSKRSIHLPYRGSSRKSGEIPIHPGRGLWWSRHARPLMGWSNRPKK